MGWEQDHCDVYEAARLLNISPARVRQMLRAGELQGERGRPLVEGADVLGTVPEAHPSRRPRRASAIRNLAYPYIGQTSVAAAPTRGGRFGRIGPVRAGVMRDPGCGRRGMLLPRTKVNRDKERTKRLLLGLFRRKTKRHSKLSCIGVFHRKDHSVSKPVSTGWQADQHLIPPNYRRLEVASSGY